MSDLTAGRRFIIGVEGVPASPSPISNAVVVGGTCWISGQLSVGNDGRYRPGTAREEAARALAPPLTARSTVAPVIHNKRLSHQNDYCAFHKTY